MIAHKQLEGIFLLKCKIHTENVTKSFVMEQLSQFYHCLQIFLARVIIFDVSV